MAISSFGPSDWGSGEIELWDDLMQGYSGLKNDTQAATLFSAGWLSPDINQFDKNARKSIRKSFYSHARRMGYDIKAETFDWELWRAYLGY